MLIIFIECARYSSPVVLKSAPEGGALWSASAVPHQRHHIVLSAEASGVGCGYYCGPGPHGKPRRCSSHLLYAPHSSLVFDSDAVFLRPVLTTSTCLLASQRRRGVRKCVLFYHFHMSGTSAS